MGWFDEQGQMTEDEAKSVVEGLSKESGASVEASDITNLMGKNPGDVQGAIAALSAQYTARGSNLPGGVPRNDQVGSSSNGGGMSGYGVQLPQVPYTPFTQTFAPSVSLPPDVLQALNTQFDKTYTPMDPSAIGDDPLVKARVKLGLDTVQKGAAARGTLLTPGVQGSIATMAGDAASGEYWNLRNAASQDFMNAYGIFQGNNQMTLADRAQRAGIVQNQENFDLGKFNTDYSIFRNNQLDPFGMGVQTYQLGQADRSLNETQRMDTFGMNRTTKMDDFNIFNTTDTNYYDRLFKQAQLGQSAAAA